MKGMQEVIIDRRAWCELIEDLYPNGGRRRRKFWFQWMGQSDSHKQKAILTILEK